jgi:sigma-B regulation protein RsbQ
VRIAGARDASQTIVLSHGFGTDQSCWNCVVSELERDFRLVLFNHAGSGASGSAGWDARRYSRLEAFAADLVALAEELRLENAVLLGHSAGGMIGLLAAIKAPSRFSRLVMIGASACYQDEPGYEGGCSREDLVHLYRLLTSDYAEWVRQFVPRVTGKSEGDALYNYLTEMLKRLRPHDALAMATTVFESDYREWLFLVQQPTLILQAKSDPVVPPAAAEYLRANIRNSRLVTLDATGHFPFAAVPGELAAAVREFCRAPVSREKAAPGEAAALGSAG